VSPSTDDPGRTPLLGYVGTAAEDQSIPYRSHVTRIVLDANSLRRAHFRRDALAQWVEAAGGGDVEILVPEVVVWEWAEHASLAIDAVAGVHRDFAVDGLLHRLPELPSAIPKAELVERIMKGLPEGVTIWRPGPSVWRAAVESQVLQTGVGERKHDVKTGASDAVVLACVSEQVESRRGAEAVVLATSDKRLRESCETLLGDAVLYVNGTGQLLARLLHFEPAVDEFAEEVEDQLAARIKNPRSDIGMALQTFEMGFDVVSPKNLPDGPRRIWRELATLGRVEIVELHAFDVAATGDEPRIGLAEVRIFADVNMTALSLREGPGIDQEWVQSDSGTVSGGYIDLPLRLTFDRHWDLQTADAAGVARINLWPCDDDDEEEQAED
jgi:rRNA-processing protein FCF1